MSNTDFKVDISRQFPVAVSELYLAWTEPDQLKKWWKPMNKILSGVTNDLKNRGTVTYTFDDNDLVIEGKYAEVKENEKLVYTWNWKFNNDEIKNSAYQLTVEFSGESNNSNIHVVQKNFEDEEGTLPHREGWEKGLNDLGEFLENGSK